MLSKNEIALVFAELKSLLALDRSRAAEPLTLQWNLFNR